MIVLMACPVIQSGDARIASMRNDNFLIMKYV
jgi:hypothetical protein